MLRISLFVAAGLAAAVYGPQLMQDVVARTATGESVFGQSEVKSARAVGGTMVLKASKNGHFYTTTRINGRPVNVVVDTGASVVALRYEDARAIGINPSPSDFTEPVRTAAGIVKTAPVTLREVRLGSIRVSNVRGLVNQRGNQGITLLGMTFLNRLSRAELRSGQLVLTP